MWSRKQARLVVREPPCFDYGKTLNTPNLSPMLGSNGAGTGISLVYLCVYQTFKAVTIQVEVVQGFSTGDPWAKSGSPTILGWPFVSFELHTNT